MNFLRKELKRFEGFTLIELLVAMTVLCLLVVTLFGLLDGAVKLWRENENRVDAFREARAAMNIISGDLRSYCAATNMDFFSTNDSGSNGLYFLSVLPPSAQPSDRGKSGLCAVGYFLRWGSQTEGLGTNATDPTKRGLHLYRSLYASDFTYSNLVSGLNPITNLANPTDGRAVAPEILARNILSFEVRCFQINPTYKSNATGTPYQSWVRSIAVPYPDMVELRLTALPEEAARRLGGASARWATNDPVVQKEMRTFVSRIRMRAISTN